MRRFPRFLLLAALGTAVVPGIARADEVVAPADAAPADAALAIADAAVADVPSRADEAAAAAPSVSASPSSTPSPSAADAPAAASTVSAGSVEGKADDDAKEGKFPLHANASLSNSFGNGLIAPIGPLDAYQPQPNWSSSLSLGGNAGLPKVDFLPKMSLSAGVSFSVNNWIPAYSNGGAYDRAVRASDINLGLGMPGAFTEDFTKIKVGLSFSGRIPTSITSRQQNLFTALGASIPVGWSSEEFPWGQIGVTYSLGGRVSLYTADAPTIGCEAAVSLGSVVTNPLENGDLPLAYGREAEVGPNGECLLRGRQGVASLSNNLGASWSLQGHSVGASLGWSVGFLRPISNRPELRSEFATSQNFNESVNGNLSYSYEIPVDFPLSVSAGIGSGQSPYRVNDEGKQELVNPFFDFFTPANNYSAAFVDVSIGI